MTFACPRCRDRGDAATARPTRGAGPPSRTRTEGHRVTRVLVVDDEPQILRALRINLTARQYDVVTAGDRRAGACSAAATADPDLVVLDLGLPDIDGVEVDPRAARAGPRCRSSCCPAAADSRDKVDALDAGADDYVTKPFSIDELLARIRAVTRRRRPPAPTPHRRSSTRPHTVDLGRPHGSTRQRRRPGSRGAPDPAPSGSCSRVLLRHPGKLVSQRQLLREVWGPTYERRDPVPAPVHGPAAPQARGPTRPARATCSPNPAWATASSPERLTTPVTRARPRRRNRVKDRP